MTLAFALASADPPDDVGAPARYAGSAAEHREREAAIAVAARDHAWAKGLRLADESEARDAFNHIMHAYADRLVRFAYGLVTSADTAEDVVQDVFVRVWERRTAIRPDESLRAYLFTAVRRTALDVLKRRAVEARYAERVVRGTIEPHTVAVDEQLDAEDVTRAVQAAMARLPERRQTALRLRYEEQLPFAVVAAIMGLSEKAVKHLVTRAVDEIRGYLAL